MSIFRNDRRRKFRVILVIESILFIGLLCAILFTIQDKKSSKTVPKLYSVCNDSTPLTDKDVTVIKELVKVGLTFNQSSTWSSASTPYVQNTYSCISIYSNCNNL
jgi:hypothetical protein